MPREGYGSPLGPAWTAGMTAAEVHTETRRITNAGATASLGGSSGLPASLLERNKQSHGGCPNGLPPAQPALKWVGVSREARPFPSSPANQG